MKDSGEANHLSRVTRTRAQARAMYDRLSGWYGWLSTSETPFRERGLQMLAAREGERVLEIGFGTGACLDALAQAIGKHGFAAGIDLSFGMAVVAKQNLHRSGAIDRTLLSVGDAVVLPYLTHSFDAVFTTFTLELFDTPEIVPVLKECRRVLTPSGRLCVVSLSKPDQPDWPIKVYEWFHRQMPAVVDCRPIQVAKAMRAAGFQIEQIEIDKMWGLPIEMALARPA